MTAFEEVKQYINETVRKELAPTRIAKVNIREGLTSFEEDPAYHIDVIIDGDLPDGKSMGLLDLALFKHLWEIKDEHFPIVHYIGVEEEAEYYAPR